MRVTLESRVHQRHTRGGLQSSPPAGRGLNHGINRASGGALSGSGAWRAGVAGEASGAAGGLPRVPPAQGVPGLRSPLHAPPPEPRPGQGDDALSRPGGGSPRSARQGVGAVSLRWGRPLPTSRRSPGARTSPWLPPPTRTRNSRPPPVPSPTQRLPPRQPGSLPSSLRRLASASLSGAHCAGALKPRPSLLAPPSFRAPPTPALTQLPVQPRPARRPLGVRLFSRAAGNDGFRGNPPGNPGSSLHLSNENKTNGQSQSGRGRVVLAPLSGSYCVG